MNDVVSDAGCTGGCQVIPACTPGAEPSITTNIDWELLATKGNDGAPGLQGIQGPPGAQGVTGSQGAIGPPGAQRPTALTGAVGLPGPIAPAGARRPQGPQRGDATPRDIAL